MNEGNQGTGITLTFVTSDITLQIVDIRHSGIARGSVDTTHSATTAESGVTWKTFRPSDLADLGNLEIDVHFDPRLPVPFNSREDLKINFPPDELETVPEVTGPIHTFKGFVIADDRNFQPLSDETMKATIRIKASGKITITPATTA